MTDFREVTDEFAVSPQILPQDLAAAAEQGFSLIINNRPDGEAADQPAGAAIEAAARSLGLDYLFIPVTGRPSLEQARAVRVAAEAASGKVLAFCRSGTRSITAWALGQTAAGLRSREDILGLARAAGYELTGVI